MPSSDPPSAGVTWTEVAVRARTFRLEITFQFETTDPLAIAQQLDDLAAKPEAGQAAQVAAHYAELARRGRRFVGTAVLDGGPRDPHAKADYHHAFRILVHQAIRLAGFLLPEEEAFQVWSERLRRGKYSLKLGTIEDAGEATALLGEHFSTIGAADVRREFAFALGDVLETPESVLRNENVPLGACVFRYVEMRLEMSFAGRTAFAVPQGKKGVELIRTLLETPNVPINVMTLMRPEVPSDRDIDETEVTITAGGAGVETADLETQKQCKHEIAELEQDLAEALRRDDQDEADRCRGEVDRIRLYLSSSFTHHGQSRVTGKDLKRAQEAIQKQFKRALLDIEARHPDLAAYLRQTITTGYTCVYETNDGTQWVTR